MKPAVIGRFQGSFLTKGHTHLIDTAQKDADELIIIIGDSKATFTDKHPLTFEMRADMVIQQYPQAKVYKLDDHIDDGIWSNNLDQILDEVGGDIKLFCSRDSFKKYYTGKYEVIEIDEIPDVSATDLRKSLMKYDPSVHNNVSFRSGVIHATQNKYPAVIAPVDIALVDYNWNILLGRKPDEIKYCIIGGFSDPALDDSFEMAANRELSEEVLGDYVVESLKHLGSFKIDDWRYRGTKDAVITTLYMALLPSECDLNTMDLKAGDDLEEVKVFNILNIDINTIVPHHHILFNHLKKHYAEKRYN